MVRMAAGINSDITAEKQRNNSDNGGSLLRSFAGPVPDL
jgi:hypothetical protein